MKNKKGVVLISVVVIILTMALIGASLIAFYTSVNLSARQSIDDAKAFYLAEAGIAYAIHQMRQHANAQMPTAVEDVIGPVSLGEGSFSVTIDMAQAIIISTGMVGDSVKRLQLQYSLL